MSAEQERAAIVADYLDAYEAANGAPCPYIIKYKRGWFQFWRSGYSWASHRKAGIIEMTANLRNRIAREHLAGAHRQAGE